jgi:hypothetical protein
MAGSRSLTYVFVKSHEVFRQPALVTGSERSVMSCHHDAELVRSLLHLGLVGAPVQNGGAHAWGLCLDQRFQAGEIGVEG